MNIRLKTISLFVTLAMLFAVLAGCSDSAAPEESSAQTPEVSESAPPEQSPTPAATPSDSQPEPPPEPELEPEPEPIKISYPLDTGAQKLSVWLDFPMNLSDMVGSISEVPSYAVMEELTGVVLDLDEVHISMMGEKFNLMVVSRDMTDIICNGANLYTGGVDLAVDEEVYFDLKEYLPEYAPDYWAMLNADPAYLKAATTDSGRIASISAFYDETPRAGNGLMIRGDLLEQTGMDAPETYDEYTQVLKAIQTLGVKNPMWSVFGGMSLTSAGYGIPDVGFYTVDGKVRFSVVENGFKDYVEQAREWCELGFYPDDWLSINNPIVDAGITSGKAAVFETALSRIGQLYNAMAEPDAYFLPLRTPIQNEGDTTHFSARSTAYVGGGNVVTTSCKNIELALNWMNFFYTEPGIMLYNYGIEDVSYVYGPDGTPEFTELVTNNPDGRSFSQSKDYYCYNGYGGRVRLLAAETASYTEDMFVFCDTWEDNNDGDYVMPSSVALTATEGEECSAIYSDIETYIEESLTKFVVGDTDMSKWDSFVQQIYDMKLEKCIDFYQTAYQRYIDR